MTNKLSGSQLRSAAALIFAGILDLNEVLKSATSIPSLHIPLYVTGTVSLAALLITSFSRSLDKSNSGNNAGLAGQPVPTLSVPMRVELATAPQMVTAAGASILEVLVPRLPPALQAVAAGMVAALLTDHLKAEGEEAQTQADTIKKNATLMGGLGAAADARAADPPGPSNGGTVMLTDTDTAPAPISREADAGDAPKPVTELSQE